MSLARARVSQPGQHTSFKGGGGEAISGNQPTVDWAGFGIGVDWVHLARVGQKTIFSKITKQRVFFIAK